MMSPSCRYSSYHSLGIPIDISQRVEDDDTEDDDSADSQDVTDGYVLGRRQGAPGLHRLMGLLLL
jgi:hypothetical protein